jgi:hypothetical protein
MKQETLMTVYGRIDLLDLSNLSGQTGQDCPVQLLLTVLLFVCGKMEMMFVCMSRKLLPISRKEKTGECGTSRRVLVVPQSPLSSLTYLAYFLLHIPSFS